MTTNLNEFQTVLNAITAKAVEQNKFHDQTFLTILNDVMKAREVFIHLGYFKNKVNQLRKAESLLWGAAKSARNLGEIDIAVMIESL